jgi:hypothetical protein
VCSNNRSTDKIPPQLAKQIKQKRSSFSPLHPKGEQPKGEQPTGLNLGEHNAECCVFVATAAGKTMGPCENQGGQLGATAQPGMQ